MVLNLFASQIGEFFLPHPVQHSGVFVSTPASTSIGRCLGSRPKTATLNVTARRRKSEVSCTPNVFKNA